MGRGVVVLVFVLGLAAVYALLPTRHASAEIDDPTGLCSLVLIIDGQRIDVAQVGSTGKPDAIEISEGESVSYEASFAGPVDHSSVALELPGPDVTLSNYKPSPGVTSWTGQITPDEYADLGTGYHIVKWVVRSGDRECVARAMFHRDGGLFDGGKVAVGATAAVLLGGVAFTLSVGGPALTRITLTFKVILGGGRKRREEEGFWSWLTKPKFKPSVKTTGVSTVAGFLIGGGGTVLAQQGLDTLLSVDLVLKVMWPSLGIPLVLQGLTVFDRIIYEGEVNAE